MNQRRGDINTGADAAATAGVAVREKRAGRLGDVPRDPQDILRKCQTEENQSW